MNTLIIIGGAHSLYISFLVLSKKNKTITDFLLTSILLLLFAIYSLVFISFENNIPELLLLLTNISLLTAPLAYIYITSLMAEKFKLRPVHLLHFLPYAFSSVYYTALILFTSTHEIDRLFLTTTSIADKPFLLVVFYFAELLIDPVYLLLVLYRLRIHRKNIKTKFSYSKNINLNWVRVMMFIIGATWLTLIISLYLPGQQQYTTEETRLQIGFAISSLFIFGLGYFGFKQKTIFKNEETTPAFQDNKASEKQEGEKYKKSKLDQPTASRYLSELRQFMSEKKPYLNSRFTLRDLSSLTNISAHNISQVLNEYANDNFYSFVNKYRIEEFKKQINLPANKSFSILAIAYDCGFSSKSSFNRIFKENVGQTPSQYIRSINTTNN